MDWITELVVEVVRSSYNGDHFEGRTDRNDDVFYVRLEGKRRKMTLEQLELQGCHVVRRGNCGRNRFGSKW